MERETKLDAAPDLSLPDLDDLVHRSHTRPDQEPWATYFDSDDLRLWNRGVTLRYRSGEDNGSGCGTWTLKLPDGMKRGSSRTLPIGAPPVPFG